MSSPLFVTVLYMGCAPFAPSRSAVDEDVLQFHISSTLYLALLVRDRSCLVDLQVHCRPTACGAVYCPVVWTDQQHVCLAV